MPENQEAELDYDSEEDAEEEEADPIVAIVQFCNRIDIKYETGTADF